MGDDFLSRRARESGVPAAELLGGLLGTTNEQIGSYTDSGRGAGHQHITAPSQADTARFLAQEVLGPYTDNAVRKARETAAAKRDGRS